jgi:hypothetical protein
MAKENEVPGELVPPPQVTHRETPAQRLEAPGELDLERVKLITRLLIGVANEGGEYLLDHLRHYQTIAEELVQEDKRSNLDEASRNELVRYLLVGSAVRTQRRALELTSDGLNYSFGLMRKTTSILDSLTDNPLGRPFRWPAERLAARLNHEINESVVVGHKEVLEGSILVRESSLDIIDEFIAYISESPELADLVREQISQQSLGMASAMTETSREITGKADETVEDKLRGWLGLPPRSELPKSPFAGKPTSIHHPGLGRTKPKSSAADGHSE